MKNYFTKQNIISFLIIAALIGNVSISSISNSSTISLLIKCAASTFLLSIFFISISLSGVSLKSFITLGGVKRILFLSAVIIAYLSITLLYSSNSYYGAQKIINIIISDIPNIFVLFYLIAHRQKEPYEEYLVSIIAAGFILTLIAVLITQPFDQSTSYYYEPGRWSHVFIGRMISFLTLIVFLYLLDQKKTKRIIIYSFIFTIGLYITYLTGLRSALIGLALCIIGSVIWNLYKKNLSKSHFYSMSLILIVTAALIFITPQGFSTSQRLSNLVKIEDLDFGGDAAISTRLESYKISWQMFKESPIIGYGFGSFNGYKNIEWTTIQKYPHNIILEIVSELGLAGFLLFCLLLFYVVKRIMNSQSSPDRIGMSQSLQIINQQSSIIILLVFSLWMAMWSKDISTQGFLWLFMVFVGIGKRE